MVFFVCNGCNETLKKNAVDKHASRCRMCNSVSCVDCSVCFYGNDYAAHTTCVSEAQKYEGSLYKAPKKKANPQDAWMDVVSTAAQAASSHPSRTIRDLVPKVNGLNNVPRNQKKFGNFIKNSLRINDDGAIEEIWQFIVSFNNKNCPDTAATTKSTECSAKDDTPNGDSAAAVIGNNDEIRQKKRKQEVPDEDKAIQKNDIESTEGLVMSKKKKAKKDKKKQPIDEEEAKTETEEQETLSSSDQNKKNTTMVAPNARENSLENAVPDDELLEEKKEKKEMKKKYKKEKKSKIRDSDATGLAQ